MPKLIANAYYSNLVTRRRAPEFSFSIAISDFFVCALKYFLSSALIGETLHFSKEFRGVEYIAARGPLLPLPDGTQTLCCFSDLSGSYSIALSIL